MPASRFLNKISVRKALITVSLIFAVLMVAVPAVAVTTPRPVPLTSYVVRMDVAGGPPATFSEIRYVGSENEVIESRITDSKGQTVEMKRVGNLKIPNIELKRALSSDMMLCTWRQQVVNGDPKAKKNVDLYIYDSSQNVAAQWNLTNAWPSSLISGVDDKSDGKLNEIVTLVCEQIERVK